MTTPIALRWLHTPPLHPTGVTFGVPWPQGALTTGEPVTLQRAAGIPVPTQSWPLAYWPDGSIKWLGLAAVLGPDDVDGLQVVKGETPAPPTPVHIEQIGIEIFKRVHTGVMHLDIGDRGVCLIQEIVHGDRTVAGALSLVCRLERRAEEHGEEVIRRENCVGVIRRLTIEQTGPVRAVVQLEGVYRGQVSGREWLPFTVRLVCYAGLESIELTHSFIYDGDARQDFIAGLGVCTHVPLLDTLENRHVRLIGEGGGVWIEPARYPYNNSPVELRLAQLRAEHVEPQGASGMLAAWDSFQLWQDSADHFVVRKRQTGPVCWVDCAHGNRAPGVAAVSDPGGGMAVGVADFWQSHPAALQVDGLTGAETTLTVWFWAPDSPPMDLRHYGTRDHRPIYEAVNPDPAVYSSPYGIARTNRLTLWALPPAATNQGVADRATLTTGQPLPVCTPEYYRACAVFGPWGLVDRTSPAKAAIEDALDRQLAFYRDQLEERRWYGFWHYGDVMHTYDYERHVWRYDLGGFAWNNAELATDLWLWYAFIRSGDPDAFRLAAAMTRHVSEVDSYHLGLWKGQGSRHNVVHWGCPCKEPRVCAAGPKRFLYYLTADERMGDLLWETAEADLGRATNTPTEPDVFHARIGPTWATFCANWLAAWERTNDPQWREKILCGIEGILQSPYRLLTGTPFLYDPATGAMVYRGDDPYAANRLVSVFGGAEAWLELADLLDHPAFADAVGEYGVVHALTPEAFAELPEGLARTISLRSCVAKLAAFAAARRNDDALAQRVWQLLTDGDGFGIPHDDLPAARYWTVANPLRPKPLHEATLQTNHHSQWALNVIAALGLVGDAL